MRLSLGQINALPAVCHQIVHLPQARAAAPVRGGSSSTGTLTSPKLIVPDQKRLPRTAVGALPGDRLG